MKAGIEIDDELLAKAKQLSGLDEQATVEAGLRELVRLRRQGEIHQAFGKFSIDPAAARDVSDDRRR